MRLLVFIPPKSPQCLSGCFHVSRQDFIFYQSRGVAPGRGRDARASDANQAILAEDADLQSGDGERLEEFLSGIRLGSRWGWCVSVKRIGNWWGKRKLLGVRLTCENWLIWHHGLVEDSWTFRRNSVKWEEQDGGWKGYKVPKCL